MSWAIFGLACVSLSFVWATNSKVRTPIFVTAYAGSVALFVLAAWAHGLLS